MVKEYEPDAIDLRLVHALQIDPRASWSDLSPVVGADAVTLARRWERLSSSGLAWVSGYSPGKRRSTLALIEVECGPGGAMATFQSLAGNPDIISVDFTAGSRDLILTFVAKSMRDVTSFVLYQLGEFASIRSARTHLVTDVIKEGGAWRLRELSAGDIQRIPPLRPPRPRASRQIPDDLQRVIESELAANGRATTSDIATKAGVTSQRVADAIAVLRNNRELLFRTDIARSYSGWPVHAWYFMQVPASSIENVREALARVEEVRLAARSASQYNLIMSVWLRTLDDVHRLEVMLEKSIPGARIADRSLVIHAGKHLGRILDENGRVTSAAEPPPPPLSQ
ncbi:Lrp/AsnC family transcriptional regulator [Paenarthrobacter sp. NPDC089322]|uniref:Lrp/AsnC family transcriptional regulator n=1 Tax=Paenarthrobacter sp. NPDC089322 TaxID=3155065 RepID=UPI00342B5321